MLGLLRRNLSSCNKDTKEVAYKALVSPLWSNTIWDPHQSAKQGHHRKLSLTTCSSLCSQWLRKNIQRDQNNEPTWVITSWNQKNQSLTVHHFQRNNWGIIPSTISHLISAKLVQNSPGNHPVTFSPQESQPIKTATWTLSTRSENHTRVEPIFPESILLRHHSWQLQISARQNRHQPALKIIKI